jgi:Tfp pilus assembly protein PilN
MRELEFLPEWYPLTRQRRRIVILQGWLILTLTAGMATYLAVNERNIKIDTDSRVTLQAQLEQTNAQLAEMDKLDSMRRQLKQQEQVVSRLGFYVYASKAIETLDALMPKQMSLTGVQLDNEEKVDNSAVQQAKGSGEPPAVDRRLKIRMQGVCPTDADLSIFLNQLSTVPFFEQVAVTYLREKSDANHVMREFEVSFSLSLNGVGS